MVGLSLALVALALALERRTGSGSACPAAAAVGPARPGPALRGQGLAMMGVAARHGRGRAWPPSRVTTGAAADDELVRAVAAGDRRALELLYRRHAPWLAGRLAAQDLLPGPGRGGPAGHLPGRLAQRPRLPRHRGGPGLAVGDRPTAAGQPGPPPAARRPVPGGGRANRPTRPPTPEEAALGRDASARIRLAISHLPAEQRAAITAVVYEGKSIQEAALAAAVPEGTLKSRLHRARLHLRKELGS